MRSIEPVEDELPKVAHLFASLCAAAVLVLSGCDSATTHTDPTAQPGSGDVREILQRLTASGEAPGALLGMSKRGDTAVLTSGVADIETREPVAKDSRFRIGSMSKMFTATVVLQLVGEGKVVLDAPIERYLPGVISGHGDESRNITVRQLLQHTSGLPDYLQYLDLKKILTAPRTHYDPWQLVQLALEHPRQFPPGTDWQYSNTNYVLAGILVEKVTGRPFGAEIDRRIIQALGLRDTSVPGDHPAIPGPHPRGYAEPEGSLIDVTEFNPSIAGAAGAMISSAADMNRFLGHLLGGRLLAPAELEEMMTTRATGRSAGSAYGLGLQRMPLACGGVYWGHNGDIFGFQTIGGATTDGRSATVIANLHPGGSDAQDTNIQTALTTALCESTPAEPTS